jgi:hypothetical protein
LLYLRKQINTMLKLLLATAAMMGLTFVIGFIVAFIIKSIAWFADNMDYFSSHRVELERLKKMKRMRLKLIQILEVSDNKKFHLANDKRDDWSRGINNDHLYVRDPGYYHGVSKGESKLDLLDYYYPDTKLLYLKKQSELIDSQKKSIRKHSFKK